MLRRLRYGIEMRMARRRHATALPVTRTWIHPSELPGPFDHAHLPPPRPELKRRFQVAVASTASVLLATGGVLLAASATPPAGAASGPKIAPSIATLPAADRSAAATLLPLFIVNQWGEHTQAATAMVLPPGDLAVTTTPVPPGAMVRGRSPGHSWMLLQVLGRDGALGVTVLRMPFSLPITVTAALGPAVNTGGAPTSLTALATIQGATNPVEFEYGPAFLTASETPIAVGSTVLAFTPGRSLAGDISGALVLDGNGRAVAAEVPMMGDSSFVSATFLQTLAQRLVLGDARAHGWLQVRGASTATGLALVASVARHGASWGKVRVGDEILAVNSVAVHSMADVDTLLYTCSPGTPVTLTIVRDGSVRNVSVRLAGSP